MAETDGAIQVPVPVGAPHTRGFHMWLAGEKGNARVEIDVIVEAPEPPAPQAVWMSLNSASLGTAREIREGPTGAKRARTITFAAPASAVRDGRNVLVFRSEGPPLTVLGVDVRMDP